MKTQKINKFLQVNLYLVILSFFVVWTVFWAYTSYMITPQNALSQWSYNSIISFTWSTWKEGYYVNDKDNSSIIWNYFKWYYFDNVYWFFKLDWSSNSTDNVRILWSTTACSTWYGYKLWWKAYSEKVWFIDFNYSADTYVYYCLDDKKLHWKAYWKYIWTQSFEWIQVDVVVDVVDLVEKVNNTTIFKNDTTQIEKSTTLSQEEIKTLWWNLIQIDEKSESIFYIIK